MKKHKYIKRAIIFILSITMLFANVNLSNVQAAGTNIEHINKNTETTLEKLQNLIAEADKLKEEDYTEESWEEFKEVRDSIDDPTQIPEKYLQNTIDMLQAAMDQLEKKSEDDGKITDGIYQVPLSTYTDKYKNVETWHGYGRY